MNNENEVMEKAPVLTKKDCVKGAIRWSLMAITTFNYDTQLAPAVVFGIGPLLRKIYKDDDEYVEALNNHYKYFNTMPWLANIVLGATLALEDKEGITSLDAVQNIKVSLMGPLAGIGDTLFWTLLPTIMGSIAGYMALEGNPIGVILWLIVNLIFICIRLFVSLANRASAVLSLKTISRSRLNPLCRRRVTGMVTKSSEAQPRPHRPNARSPSFRRRAAARQKNRSCGGARAKHCRPDDCVPANPWNERFHPSPRLSQR